MSDFLLYLQLGWEHIISLDALDHQLFVLVLVAVYAISDLKKILILVTAFTIGHSLTLLLSVLDLVRIPSHWVEFLIPLTIFITSLDNVLMRNKPRKLMKMNYYLALFFGLIHGMGFANTARMSLATEQEIAVPLLGFNLGLELGQMLVVGMISAVYFVVVKKLKASRHDWILFVSAAVFALSLQLMLQRFPTH